jgi:hypothetical protein
MASSPSLTLIVLLLTASSLVIVLVIIVSIVIALLMALIISAILLVRIIGIGIVVPAGECKRPWLEEERGRLTIHHSTLLLRVGAAGCNRTDLDRPGCVRPCTGRQWRIVDGRSHHHTVPVDGSTCSQANSVLDGTNLCQQVVEIGIAAEGVVGRKLTFSSNSAYAMTADSALQALPMKDPRSA